MHNLSAQQAWGDFAPKFAELADKVLFGDIWERKELSKRDRSLATVAALVALNRTDQLRFHLHRALENGVKKQELIEEITHLAFYSGWPTAVNALTVPSHTDIAGRGARLCRQSRCERAFGNLEDESGQVEA